MLVKSESYLTINKAEEWLIAAGAQEISRLPTQQLMHGEQGLAYGGIFGATQTYGLRLSGLGCEDIIDVIDRHREGWDLHLSIYDDNGDQVAGLYGSAPWWRASRPEEFYAGSKGSAAHFMA